MEKSGSVHCRSLTSFQAQPLSEYGSAFSTLQTLTEKLHRLRKCGVNRLMQLVVQKALWVVKTPEVTNRANAFHFPFSSSHHLSALSDVLLFIFVCIATSALHLQNRKFYWNCISSSGEIFLSIIFFINSCHVESENKTSVLPERKIAKTKQHLKPFWPTKCVLETLESLFNV